MEGDVIRIDITKTMHTVNGVVPLVVDATIRYGEFVALFGPSGAGKTTLLRILAGLEVADHGMIRVGTEVWFDTAKGINLSPQHRNLSLMFQDYALFPNMTVEQQIRFAQTDKAGKALEELLNAFGLIEFRNRKPASLSGGQKQRVALARALARRPRLLLLDEPLSALDSATRISLQDEIERARRLSGATVLMVSHDLAEVFRLVSHVLRLENGRIIGEGNPADVFSDRSISGKVQITGQIARIEKQDAVNLVTVISNGNQIMRVIAFDNDIENLSIGDHVIVFTKAFNPGLFRVVIPGRT